MATGYTEDDAINDGLISEYRQTADQLGNCDGCFKVGKFALICTECDREIRVCTTTGTSAMNPRRVINPRFVAKVLMPENVQATGIYAQTVARTGPTLCYKHFVLPQTEILRKWGRRNHTAYRALVNLINKEWDQIGQEDEKLQILRSLLAESNSM